MTGLSSMNQIFLNGNITGNTKVGGVVGELSTTLNNSFANISVSGNFDIGGLVGATNSYGGEYVSNSYVLGTVSGNTRVGGLVGNNYGTNLENLFTDAVVIGGSNSGGLVGLHDDQYTNLYWNNKSSSLNAGISSEIYVIQDNFSYFLDPTKEPMISWDPNIWDLTEGQLPFIQALEDPFNQSTPQSLEEMSTTVSSLPGQNFNSIIISSLLLSIFLIF